MIILMTVVWNCSPHGIALHTALLPKPSRHLTSESWLNVSLVCIL